MNIEKIIFIITELTKTRKVSGKRLQMTCQTHREIKLNVRDYILSYLKKTTNLKEHESKLVISFIKPHKTVKPNTAAGWLKNMLKEAGVDTGELLHQRQPNLGFHCNKSETKLIGNYETLSRNFTINFFRLIMINLLRKFCKCKKKICEPLNIHIYSLLQITK